MQNYQQAISMSTQVTSNNQSMDGAQQQAHQMGSMGHQMMAQGISFQQAQMIHVQQQHQQQQQQQAMFQQQHTMHQQIPYGMILVQAPSGGAPMQEQFQTQIAMMQSQYQPQLTLMQQRIDPINSFGGTCQSFQPKAETFQPQVEMKQSPLQSLQQSHQQNQQELYNLKAVSSSGMLLPLVSQQQQDAAPSNQMMRFQAIQPSVIEGHAQQCATVIQQALTDPNLASAGHLLLQAMNASSSFMNSLMEQQKPNEHTHMNAPLSYVNEVPSSDTVTGNKRLVVTSVVEPRQETPIPKVVKSYEVSPPLSSSSVSAKNLNTFSSVFSTQHNGTASSETVFPSITPVSTPAPESNAYSAPPLVVESRHPCSPKPKNVTIEKKIIVHKASCGQTAGKAHRINPVTTVSSMTFQGTPQEYLMVIVKDRGYACQRLSSSEAGYQQDPTPLQVASFGTEVVKAVNSGDTEALEAFLDCGLSPNPCNSFGDSILSLICKRADENMFQVFLERGCDLQVSDSFGRTPLHNAAWAGEFSKRMIKLILDHDLLQLMVQDKQGKCALEYVRKEHYQHWISFLKETLDVYWPLDKNLSPLMTATLPLERGPLPDPINPLSVALACQVASGKISVEEVAKMDFATRRSFNEKVPPQKFSLFGSTMS